MKIEQLVTAPVDGTVLRVAVGVGQTVSRGDVIADVLPGPVAGEGPPARDDAPPATGTDRADLAEVLRRRALLGDDARPEATSPIWSPPPASRSTAASCTRPRPGAGNSPI